MTDKTPLLWHSNAPHAGTGYAQQTALFAPRLHETYDVAISAFYGVEGGVLSYKGVPVLPGIAQTHGNETVLDHAGMHFKGDLRSGTVLTLMDVWVLDPSIWRQVNLGCWVPIDHEPVPPPIARFLRESSATPLAMSKFGQRELARVVGLDPLYVPHAVDTKVFKRQDKTVARGKLGLPEDAFIVGVVAANKGNPSRKCFPEMLAAFAELRRQHSDAILFLHTELSGKFDGVNLPDLIEAVGIPREAVMFADQYRMVHYPAQPDRMATMYSSFDVLLQTSAGEGFGIPTLEAAAVGVPAIVSDFSAQPELCPAGWLVEGQRNYTRLKAWQFTPNVGDIADALRQAYNQSDAHRAKAAEISIEFAQDYDVDKVLTEHMLPAIETIHERSAERAPRELSGVGS